MDTVSSELERAPNYLGRWHDPELKLPNGLLMEDLVREHLTRLSKSISVVAAAAGHSRRLGRDVTDVELAIDKKRARRVSHALVQAYGQWTKKSLDSVSHSDEVKQAGAQLLWPDFIAGHTLELDLAARRAATFALRSGDPKILRWGKTAITNLENERRWIAYAMRD